MKTSVLLCGTNKAGKTKTLKAFFEVSHRKRLGPMEILRKVLNGVTIYAVSLSSPQEQSPFCDVSKVEKRIEKRIKKCEQTSNGQDYVLLIPFGIYQKTRREKQLNERCILEPIEWLGSLGLKVVPVYLRKETARLLPQKDMLMKKITSLKIKSYEDYERQAKELETIIKNL